MLPSVVFFEASSPPVPFGVFSETVGGSPVVPPVVDSVVTFVPPVVPSVVLVVTGNSVVVPSVLFLFSSIVTLV